MWDGLDAFMIWLLLTAHVLWLVAFFWFVRRSRRRLADSETLRLRQVGDVLMENKNLQQRLDSSETRHRAEMTERDDRVSRIVNELSHLRWNKRSDQYTVQVCFDPRMLGGRFDQDDLRYIAKYMGDAVAHEIASCKFIREATKNERERLYPEARKVEW